MTRPGVRLRSFFVCLRGYTRPLAIGKGARLYKSFVFPALELRSKEPPALQKVQAFVIEKQQMAPTCTLALCNLCRQLQHVVWERCHVRSGGIRELINLPLQTAPMTETFI